MAPDVLHLILCDRVEMDPENYHRYNIFGLVTSIRTRMPQFPVTHPRLVALLVWTGGPASGELALRIVQDQSLTTVFRTPTHQVRLVGDPSAIGGGLFLIRNCAFPSAGLYWVEVLFAGSVIARQRLLVRVPGSLP